MRLTIPHKHRDLIAIATISAFLIWSVAALASAESWTATVPLVLAQSALMFVSCVILARETSDRGTSAYPTLNYFLIAHVLIYYGVANVIPALLPELRPDSVQLAVTYRIPQSPASAYALASASAILFLLGTVFGANLAPRYLAREPRNASAARAARPYFWLPSYSTGMIACILLLIALCFGSYFFGYQWGALDPEVQANLPLGEKIFFYGLLPFLPLAPFLASGAYVQSVGARQRRNAWRLMIFSGAITLASLAIWRMRSTAMLAFMLPIALFIYTDEIDWRRAIMPATILFIGAYAVVTAVRMSSFGAHIGDVSRYSMQELLPSVTENGSEKKILDSALVDASYRAAGLEGVAALIHAQTQGYLDLKWGKVMSSGFIQDFPQSMRPESDMPEKIKSAPSAYGIFLPGDWVTTMLSELVVDFGPFFSFVPAVGVGFIFATIDFWLLKLGQNPFLEGLLLLRAPYLMYLIANGSSVEDMTVLFFKGTLGYAVILILIKMVLMIPRQRKLLTRMDLS